MIEKPPRCADAKWDDVRAEIEHWFRGATQKMDEHVLTIQRLESAVAEQAAEIAALRGSSAPQHHEHSASDIKDLSPDNADWLLTGQNFGG
jgi:hypothetical protein